MDVCKCRVSLCHGGTLNSRLDASPFVRLAEEKWEVSDHSQGVLPPNWGGTKIKKIVLSPAWGSRLRLTKGVHLALAMMNFVGLDLVLLSIRLKTQHGVRFQLLSVNSSTMDKFETVLLIFLLCFVSPATVTGSAMYPNAMSTLIQVAFDPVYWLTTFHRMDLSRQVRFRWLRLLPDLIHGRLHMRPIYR
ncbi:uncharacterized protein TNCV_4523101 [Trichonephila clavipes]|nr:uncharacterized protein TNCV_4523101 [Trichonephila clavipes]